MPSDNIGSSEQPELFLTDEESALVSLTFVERQVYGLFIIGLRWPGIARHLGINPSSIHRHKERLFQKLDAYSEIDLVLFAVRHNLIPESPES